MIGTDSRLVALSVVLVLALAGCGAVVPKVSYQEVNGQDDKGLIKFRLQRSTILLDRKKDKDGKDVSPQEILMTSVPADRADDPVYAIMPQDNFFTTTHLKVTHRANTDLIESLGTEIEDKRIQFIQQVGGFITGLLGVAGASADTFPSYIDVTKFVDEIEDKEKARQAISKTGEKLPDGNTTYNIDIGPVSKDAIERGKFITNHDGKTVSVLFYAACRDVNVHFTTDPAKNKVFNLRISDPNFVQTIQLPAKGKIDMHTGCGVNVTSEKADVATDIKIVNELISQVKSIRDASKKGGTQSSGGNAGKK